VNKPLLFNLRQYRFNSVASLTYTLNVSACNGAILRHVNAKTIQRKIYFDCEIAMLVSSMNIISSDTVFIPGGRPLITL
jgi:hypothetical protein